MKSLVSIAATLVAVGASSAIAADNAWITSNFAGFPVYTGTLAPGTVVVYPSLVRDATVTGGDKGLDVEKCLLIWGTKPDGTQGYICDRTPSTDQRIAFMHVNINHQGQNGRFGSGIYAYGDNHGDNNKLDLFLSDVTLAPYWPAFVDFQTTNMDALTDDAGWPYPWPDGAHGGVYVEDTTIKCPVASGQPEVPCVADAALDLKAGVLQANRLHVKVGTPTQPGLSTIKLWNKGPHYIVNSDIENVYYKTNPSSKTSDGGLISTYDCSALVINVYNSTFNGSPTLPLNLISCWGINGTPTINYLTVDPTTTGEMHPFFGSVPDQALAVVFPTGNITNGADTWSFSPTDTYGGNYSILKNGASAGGGYGVFLLKHNNQMYANTVGYGWFKWTGSAWTASADPR